MAAALQNAAFCLQTKIPPTARLTRTTAHKPLNLSFSAAFPSLNLTSSSTTSSSTTSSSNNRRSFGAKMSATAASSYAAALSEVALANNTLETTSADVEKIGNFFSDRSVFNFFANPTIGLSKKLEVIEEIAKSLELQPHTTNFLNILAEANRIDLVEDIVKEFETVYNKITNTEQAVVTSVVKLESQHLEQIKKQVQKLTNAKNVRIKTVIDPSLVAGFTVRYGNTGSKFIDLSVKKQLEEIASQIDLGDIELAV